jgi:Asp-tRNA(Asn)/Glu-tRNA(Gln) amidotransferase C subunit
MTTTRTSQYETNRAFAFEKLDNAVTQLNDLIDYINEGDMSNEEIIQFIEMIQKTDLHDVRETIGKFL